MSLASLTADHARARPSASAVSAGGVHWTYAEVDDLTGRAAASLLASGLAPGDRLAVFTPNRPLQVIVYLACLRCGIVAVPLNARYRGPEAAYAMRHCGAAGIVAHASRVERLADVPLDAMGVTRRWVMEAGALAPGWEPAEALTAGDTLHAVGGLPDDTRPALILYTSGTTSRPKGVVHGRAGLGWTVATQARVQRLAPDDVNLTSLSISHVAGLAGQVLPTLHSGGRVLLMDGPDAGAVLAAIAAEGATRLQMLPTSLADLVSHQDAGRTDLGSLRACIAGGDKVPLPVHRRFRELTGVPVSEVCGMTECFDYAMNPLWDRGRPGSIGLPTEGNRLRLLGDDGQDAPGGTGEIAVRSPGTMTGYWDQPAETDEALRDGWLHTGDVGRVDSDGWYWFVGRRKEIIIRAGSNVSPQEVEEALDEQPGVAESAVVGLPDPHLGERVVAFVRPAAGACPDPEALRAAVGAILAPYMVPERIWLIDEVPRNATGKADRHALRGRAEGLAAG